MAAVVASKPAGPATKMRKPSLPHVQTNTNSGRAGPPSASPSSASKRLPGASQATPVPTPSSATSNGNARPSRRLQRLSTRVGTSETLPVDRKATLQPEPFVITEKHILKKFKGRAPSLIVHLHPTHFRFDQQEGSFSYQSEMQSFITHLQRRAIPHDMLEELRKSEVKFYDGWLIVKVIDHKVVAVEPTGGGTNADDEKPASINNYNQYITPSAYASYPTKEQQVAAATPIKQERNAGPAQSSRGKTNGESGANGEQSNGRTKIPQPRIFFVGMGPTEMSKHMDLLLDAIAPDPKTKRPNQHTARTPSTAAPQTPLIPSASGSDRQPPTKKIKLRIDPRDIVEYEARTVNATAPPLYLEPIGTKEEARQLLERLKDPRHDEAPPSPKSRKRTVAELAADDAHAKEQERFMLVMDGRSTGANAAGNAVTVDSQAGTVPFQPRFEKFNALDSIKREIAEKKQREKDRQLQEDEMRRNQQQQQQEEEKRRMLAIQQAERKKIQAMVQRPPQEMAAMAAQQQQAQATAAAAAAAAAAQGQRPGAANRPATSIPPQMQNQMMAQASSPVGRQGTPHAASSPIVNNAARQMAQNGSQAVAAGSPQRPSSSLQHAHPPNPSTSMARQISSQGGPSRNGTPQIPHSTPGMGNATPILRQGTPSQHMNQASPHVSISAPTPQSNPAMMANQMPNGMMRPQITPAQIQEMQRRALQHQVQMNGGQPLNAAQISHFQAQQKAMMQQHVAQQQAQQLAQQQAQNQQQLQQTPIQQGTPQSQHLSPSTQSTQPYNAAIMESMKARVQQLQQGKIQGSPVPNQMSPQQMQHIQQLQQMQQQQQAQQQQQQQTQQQQQGASMGQLQAAMNQPNFRGVFAEYQRAAAQQLLQNESRNYGGVVANIPPQVRSQLMQHARDRAAQQVMNKQRQIQQQAAVQRMAQAQAQQQQQQQQPQPQPGIPQQQQGAGNQINRQMAAQMHQQAQQQQAQQMQAMQLQQAQQNMMAMQGQAQQQYQQQMQNMLQQRQRQQQQQQQQGQR